VLHHLVAHAGRLVTKEELFPTVWPDTAIGDAVLKVCIAEIRKALGDTAKAPQFIATMHRRGYRFIAPITAVELTEAHPAASIPSEIPPPSQHNLLRFLHTRCWNEMLSYSVCRRHSRRSAPELVRWCS
jgi:DNA-binding winged helix-turn-helix (wHTH) protein